jgi:hypothetical protein
VQFPFGVTHPFVLVPGHVPGLEPGGHLISAALNISRPVTAFRTHATAINPMISTMEYSKKLATKPANVFAFDAAKNAVPVKRPSMIPPPFLIAIYFNARKDSFGSV